MAISYPTVASSPIPDPGTASFDTVTRVQMITESGVGSPDATPCMNAAYGFGFGACGKRADDSDRDDDS